MGVKKIARPLNQFKNELIKWLNTEGYTDIEEFEGSEMTENCWDYYRNISAFSKDNVLTIIYLMIWKGRLTIELNIKDQDEQMFDSIEEFKEVMSMN